MYIDVILILNKKKVFDKSTETKSMNISIVFWEKDI